ncbi:glycosyltransferase family 2 protein, partial [Desulfobacca acetoxidans]
MVKTPFFSVIIPTKNRSDLISNAIKSILNQSFNNYEIIITDNDDTESTYNVISKFSDPKIKYFRTGNLSMPDNWEYALQFVSGEYITVLTDRCVFKPRSLEIIYDEIINSNASVISWTSDSFGYDDNQTEYAKRNCSGKRIRFDSKELLNSFVRFGKHGNCLPKLLNSCCKRTIVDLIRNSNKNRFFPPVSPDFTSCFLQLLFIDDILYIDEGLFISC